MSTTDPMRNQPPSIGRARTEGGPTSVVNAFPRVNVLGIGVSAVNMATTVEEVKRLIERRAHAYICVAAVHSVMDGLNDAGLRRVFNSSALTTPDGMGLVMLLSIWGLPNVDRVYGPDLLRRVCGDGVARGLRHYFYGSDGETLRRLEENLRKGFPGIVITGSYSPPYRSLSPEEDEEAVRILNHAGADVLWVGLGSPKQERWMAAHRGRVEAPVMIGVGAAFDFLSGRKPQAPLWIQRNGLEWLFRLATEPGRLWRRYAGYPLFAALVAAHVLGLRRFPAIDEEQRRP